MAGDDRDVPWGYAVFGSVTEGTSVLNHLPEEQEKQTTISTSIFAYDHAGKHFTLADTPGNSNFQAEGQIVLRALDGAVIVLSASDGARVGTGRMLRIAREAARDPRGAAEVQERGPSVAVEPR